MLSAFLLLLLSASFTFACQNNCLACSNDFCTQCKDRYYLTNGECIETNCKDYQLFQFSNASSGECVSICDSNYFANWKQGICQQSDSCSQQYIQASSTNKNRYIQSAVDWMGYAYLVSDILVKAIDQRTGALQRVFSFDSSIILITQYQHFILLLTSNTLSQWSPLTNKISNKETITSGVFKTSSTLISAINNSNLVFISSFDDLVNEVYLTQLSLIQEQIDNAQIIQERSLQFQFQLQLLSDTTLKIIKNHIVIQQSSSPYQIQIKQILSTGNNNPSITLLNYTQEFVCNPNGSLLDIQLFIQSSETQQSIAIFQNTIGVYAISSQINICHQIISYGMPIQMIQITLLSQYLILISFTDKTINAYYSDKIALCFSLTSSNSIIDFKATLCNFFVIFVFSIFFDIAQQGLEQMYLSVLTASNTVEIYLIQSINNIISATLLTSLASLISSPKKLIQTNSIFSTSSSNSQIASPYIYLVGQDAQIIDPQQNQGVVGIVQDFSDKIFWNELGVNKLHFSEELQIIASCGSDGKIVVWQASDPLQPVYWYSLQRNSQICINIQLYQNSLFIAQFTNEIIIFNVLNQFDYFSIQLEASQAAKTQIKVNSNYIFILSSNISILSSKDKVEFQGKFDLSQNTPIQFFLTQDNQILILDSSNTLTLFKYENNSLVINNNKYIASSAISCIYLFPKVNLNTGFYVFFSTIEKDLIILDETLQVNSKLSLIGISLKRMYDYNNEVVFFLCKYDDNTVSHQYSTYSYDYTTQKLTFMGSSYYVQEITSVFKKIDDNNTPVYTIIELSPISYTTYSVYIVWNRKSLSLTFGTMLYSPGQQQQAFKTNNDQTLVIVGAQSGQVRVAPIQRNDFPQMMLDMSSLNNEQIVSVRISYNLGIYLIITQYCANLFNLHTEQFIYQKKLNSSIIQFELNENLKIAVMVASNQIVVIDCEYFLLKYEYQSDSIINGFYLDELSNLLYYYGQGIFKIDLSVFLSQSLATSQSSNIQYIFCIFETIRVICKQSSQQIVFFDMQKSLSVLQTVQLQSLLSGFNMTKDSKYQQLFVYTSIFEIYSYDGVFQSTFSFITTKIVQFDLIGKYFMVITSATGYVLSRGVVNIAGQFTPPGGSIIQGYYLALSNQIAYASDEIRYGQVLFFDLSNMQSAGSVSNSYTNNGVGTCLKVSFDNESKMLNYLDQYGNFQNVIFSSSKTTDNTIGISEMQKQLTPIPIDYQIDWNSNTVLIYNKNKIWKINYNLMTRQYQRVLSRASQLEIVIVGQQIEIPIILVIDKYNNLYRYQNYQAIFERRFDDGIGQTISVSNSTHIAAGFMSSTNLQIFLGEAEQFKQQDFFSNNPQIIVNIIIKRIIANSEGIVAAIDKDNKFSIIDFFNGKILFQLSGMPGEYINCQLLVSKISSVFVGLRSGRVANLNLKTLVYQIISNIGESIVHGLYLLDEKAFTIAILKQNGDIFELDATTSLLLEKQSINANKLYLESLISSLGSRTSNNTQLSIQIQCGIYIIGLANQKLGGVFSLVDHSLLYLISFPDDQWKRVDCNNGLLLLSSAAQINIFQVLEDNQFKYINKVRRYNRKDRITDIRLLTKSILIIVFTSRIECISIDSNANQITLVDSVSLTDARLSYATINYSLKTVDLVGVQSTGLFEKRVSLGLFDIYQFSSSTKYSICSADMTFESTNSASAMNQLDRLATSSGSIGILLTVFISNQINNIGFLGFSGAQVILKPKDKIQNQLIVDDSSFLNLGLSQIILQGFEIEWKDSATQIQFNTTTTNITMQDISILRNVKKHQGIIIQNKKIVQIQNFLIRDVLIDSENEFFIIDTADYILIQNLQIFNSTILSTLFTFSKIQTLIIENVNIQDSILQGKIFSCVQINSLTIINVNLFNTKSTVGKNQNFLINLQGVQSTYLSNFKISHNTEIYFLSTTRSYQLNNALLTLTQDLLTISNIVMLQNIFPLSFNKDEQINFIQSQSSFVKLDGIEMSNNECNLMISQSQKIKITNSQFNNNIGIIGSSLSFHNIQNILMDNCAFTNNTAIATAAAIYLYDIDSFIISNSFFSYNQAQIGGAIRIIQEQLKSATQKDNTEIIKSCTFNNNSAAIYGKNIARYPSHVNIYVHPQASNSSYLGESQLLLSTDILSQSIQQQVNITNIGSGSNLFISLQLFDQDNNSFTLNLNNFTNTLYSQKILDELSKYQIELLSTSSSPVYIKGESLITVKQFDPLINSFVFKSMIISAQPAFTLNSIQIKLTMNNLFSPMLIPVIISFRECQIGEIPLKQSSDITTCQECSEGTYSLIQPIHPSSSATFTSQSSLLYYDLECKKCPVSAQSCHKSSIILEKGYWRKSNFSDDIIRCNSENSHVCDEANSLSKYGCLEGYIGPLCETCDSTGKIWNNQRYTLSFATLSCDNCSQQTYQSIFLIISALFLQVYLLFSVLMFMNSYIYNSKCFYLRRMSILPLSKSSIKDESTFFVKALMNYFQLSSILFSLDTSIFPPIFSAFPSFAGQPVSKIVVGGLCVYPQKELEYYGQHKLTTFAQMVFPLIFLGTTFIMLKLFQKLKFLEVGSYHKYTMINVLFLFFQPDCIKFFTNAVSCRTIGEERYIQINLMVECDNEDYTTFKYTVVIPNLFFWTLFPLITLYRLYQSNRSIIKESNQMKIPKIRNSHNTINSNQDIENKNKTTSKRNSNSIPEQQKKESFRQITPLEYTITKYKFGFFYLEFKKSFFYWEFIRIYLRIAIVISVTLLAQLELLVYVFTLILMFLYIYCVQLYEPFESKILLKLEILSYFILVVNVLLSQINSQYPAIPLRVGTALLHYGYISFVLLIILKFKINSQQKGLSRIIRIIAKRLLPEFLYFKVSKSRIKSIKPLLRWRLIFKNITLLREQKLNQQIKHIESTAKSRIPGSPLLTSNSPILTKKSSPSTISFNNQEQKLASTLFDNNLKQIHKSLLINPSQSVRDSEVNPYDIKQSQYDWVCDSSNPQNINNSNNNGQVIHSFLDYKDNMLTQEEKSCRQSPERSYNPSIFRLNKRYSESILDTYTARYQNKMSANSKDVSFNSPIYESQESNISEKTDAMDLQSEKYYNCVYSTKQIKTLTSEATK